MADKQKALETAISQIEKNFGKGSIMRLGQNTAMNVEQPKEVRLTRPFVYAIIDTQTNLPLFIGAQTDI